MAGPRRGFVEKLFAEHRRALQAYFYRRIRTKSWRKGNDAVAPSDEEIRTAIAEQAGEWFIANQAGSLAEEDSAAFLAWLKASPVHVREYLGVARIAQALSAVIGKPQVPLETFLVQAAASDPDTVVSMPRRVPEQKRLVVRSLSPRAWSIAASLLALAVGALWWAHDGELFGIPKTYRTVHGEQSIERLPDGSVLRLDTDSEATVRYSGGERLVELNRGQALFEVAHERYRRFRVAAGNAGAIAVGTQFDVYRKTGAIEFIVVQGEIAVFTGEPTWLRNGEGLPPGVQRVTAGYRLRVDAEATPAQPAPVDLGQALGWVQHKIVFEHRPLAEVAAEFNRYGMIPVEIEDEALRVLPVSGMFDAADTESFVAFLQTLPGVRVEKTPARIRVIRITPTS
jgi:transmembrane sensor